MLLFSERSHVVIIMNTVMASSYIFQFVVVAVAVVGRFLFPFLPEVVALLLSACVLRVQLAGVPGGVAQRGRGRGRGGGVGSGAASALGCSYMTAVKLL